MGNVLKKEWNREQKYMLGVRFADFKAPPHSPSREDINECVRVYRVLRSRRVISTQYLSSRAAFLHVARSLT